MGTLTMPSSTRPLCHRATEVPTCGMRCTKLVVPSTGSMIQQSSSGASSSLLLSSARKHAPGTRSASFSFKKASTARSVWVTRSMLPLWRTLLGNSQCSRMISPLCRTISTQFLSMELASIMRNPLFQVERVNPRQIPRSEAQRTQVIWCIFRASVYPRMSLW